MNRGKFQKKKCILFFKHSAVTQTWSKMEHPANLQIEVLFVCPLQTTVVCCYVNENMVTFFSLQKSNPKKFLSEDFPSTFLEGKQVKLMLGIQDIALSHTCKTIQTLESFQSFIFQWD